jgi:hypothetical protein
MVSLFVTPVNQCISTFSYFKKFVGLCGVSQALLVPIYYTYLVCFLLCERTPCCFAYPPAHPPVPLPPPNARTIPLLRPLCTAPARWKQAPGCQKCFPPAKHWL